MELDSYRFMWLLFGVVVGTQYPAITRRALCKFNEDMQLIKGERAKPIDLNKNVKKKSQKDTKTYHSDIGMAPQYSGHARGN